MGSESQALRMESGHWCERLFSFAMVLSLGFVLLITLAVNAGVALLVGYFARLLPEVGEIALQAANILISIAVTTGLFAMIFKGLPDVKIKFADVWKGALFTAVLFAVGKLLIGLYIGKSGHWRYVRSCGFTRNHFLVGLLQCRYIFPRS